MSDFTSKDTLFASPIGQIAGFSFDERVAAVFPDMLERSIPGYQTIIAQTGLLAARFARSRTRCYDLGCSLGATSLSIRNNLTTHGCSIVAVDNSAAMLATMQHNLASDERTVPLEMRCEDICDTEITNASVVALNFTLQFVPPAQRLHLLTRIADGMVAGGVLVLSEKVVFADPQLNQLHIEMYHEFKRANGYSNLEISQKRSALENVLIPDTLEQHQERIAAAGFSSASVWFQCFNFLSLVALK